MRSMVLCLSACTGGLPGYAGNLPPAFHAKSVVRLDHADQTRPVLMTQYKMGKHPIPKWWHKQKRD